MEKLKVKTRVTCKGCNNTLSYAEVNMSKKANFLPTCAKCFPIFRKKIKELAPLFAKIGVR